MAQEHMINGNAVPADQIEAVQPSAMHFVKRLLTPAQTTSPRPPGQRPPPPPQAQRQVRPTRVLRRRQPELKRLLPRSTPPRLVQTGRSI